MESISLRPASEGDWRSIASLLFENNLPHEGARAHLANFVVATTDAIVVGCAGLEVYANVALLRSVAVAPLLHRKGIGKILINRMIQHAQRRKIAKIYLRTTGAQQYFARLGFRPELIEAAPPTLKASAEFQGACPADAAFMSLSLTPSC